MANRKTKVSDFFKTDLPAFAAYDNARKIASYIDGMKISMRKIVYTLLKKYSREKTKTEAIANVCAAFTNYLHGANNLGGVCNTMAQSFVGSNNYPMLDGNSGGFGTRIDPTPAATRYTKIALAEIVRSFLNSDDEEIIGRQFFEGDYIEPKFFVPVFPAIFLNGAEGLSTGFSQKIYPRNPNEVIEYIRKKLSGTDRPRMKLLPWFKGHLGKVEVNPETGCVESFGVITKNNMNSYTVTELPIGTDYQRYIEQLDKFCESGLIQDYSDKCDTKTDTIRFELKTSREFTRKYDTERKLYDVLKLVKTLPETLCCVDENNRVREFSSVNEIIDAYIDVRLEYYNKRKTYLVEKLNREIDILESKYAFVYGIVRKTITVSDKKKSDIEAQLARIETIVKVDGSYDYLLRLPIHSLTTEKLDELRKQIDGLKTRLKTVKSTKVESMWCDDLSLIKKNFPK